MNHLALFDFDGTITKKDSLKEFLLFYHGWAKICIGFVILSPILTLYAIKVIPNHVAKQILLRYFFGKEPVDIFNNKCKDFAMQYIPKIIRADAILRINHHLTNHDKVVVVSASPENWVKPWSDSIGLSCIATKLEVRDNKITGKYFGKNCYGQEKVKRIEENINLSEFNQISAYGDSRGDREMIALAHNKYYKFFRTT